MCLIISSLGGIVLSLFKILNTQDWGNFLRVAFVTFSEIFLNALKLYEDLKDVNLVAQALNTSPEIVKSNYLNYSDEWARNRFRVLGYDKRALPQSSMKSKNRVSEKWRNSQWSSQWSLSKKVYIMLLIKIDGETERPL